MLDPTATTNPHPPFPVRISVITSVSLVEKSVPNLNVLVVEPKPPQIFPDGGYAAWKTVVGAFLIQMCGFGYTTSYGVYQDFYVRQYLTDESTSAIAWIGSVNTLLVMSAGVVSGRLYDRGYFYWLLGVGTFLTSVSLFTLSMCKPNQYYQIFLSYGLCNGIASGSMYIPSIAILSHYFKTRQHVAMAIVASGASIGAIVHPLMINKLLEAGVGFSWTVRSSAAFVTISLLTSCCLMRTRLQPTQNHPSIYKTIVGVAQDPIYILATIGFWMFIVGLYFPLFYLQLDVAKQGLSKSFAIYSLVILNVGSFFSRLSAGFLANKFGVAPLIALASLGCALVIFGMIGLSSPASVILVALLYGIFAGIVIALTAPLFTILTEDLSQLGVRMGISFAIASTGGLFGPPIQGALLTPEYKWWRPAVFSGTLGVVGSFVYLALIILMHRKSAALGARLSSNTAVATV